MKRAAEPFPALRPARRAFTLIEVLLAAVAAALIFAAIFGVFSNAMRLREKAIAHVRAARLRSRAEAIIRNDLQNAYISGLTPPNALGAILTGSQTTHNSAFPGYLQFSATTAELSDTLVGGDVQAIEYYISKDPNSTDQSSGVLVRTENRVILASTQQTPPEEPLLPGANSLMITFYDPNANSWVQSWSYIQAGDPLPGAIRLTVQFAPQGNNPPAPPLDIVAPFPITTPFTTFIPAAAATSATGGGAGGGGGGASTGGGAAGGGGAAASGGAATTTGS